MMEGEVRPLAICVFRKGDLILVAEDYDRVKDEVFYRPLGGAIKFGEYGHEAVIREIREELGSEVKNLRHIGTIENIFTFEGKKGHEIVLTYEGKLADQSIYERSLVEGIESNGLIIRALWKPLSYFQDGHYPLYPEGLLELLTKHLDKVHIN